MSINNDMRNFFNTIIRLQPGQVIHEVKAGNEKQYALRSGSNEECNKNIQQIAKGLADTVISSKSINDAKRYALLISLSQALERFQKSSPERENLFNAIIPIIQNTLQNGSVIENRAEIMSKELTWTLEKTRKARGKLEISSVEEGYSIQKYMGFARTLCRIGMPGNYITQNEDGTFRATNSKRREIGTDQVLTYAEETVESLISIEWPEKERTETLHMLQSGLNVYILKLQEAGADSNLIQQFQRLQQSITKLLV